MSPATRQPRPSVPRPAGAGRSLAAIAAAFRAAPAPPERAGAAAFLPALAVVLALVFAHTPAGKASAQTLAGSALRGHDTRAPVEVSADRVEVLDRESQAVFSGGVRVRQGALILQSNRLRVLYSRAGGGDPQIRRLDADGAVRLSSPSEQASARFAIYDVERRLITLLGDVRLASDRTSVRGNRLVIDLDTGRSTLDGRAAAGEAAGRVQGRFAVPERRTGS